MAHIVSVERIREDERHALSIAVPVDAHHQPLSERRTPRLDNNYVQYCHVILV